MYHTCTENTTIPAVIDWSLCSSFQVSSDVFLHCRSPTVFVVGSRGSLTSVNYLEVSGPAALLSHGHSVAMETDTSAALHPMDSVTRGTQTDLARYDSSHSD